MMHRERLLIRRGVPCRYMLLGLGLALLACLALAVVGAVLNLLL
jgi:hypothetical protein